MRASKGVNSMLFIFTEIIYVEPFKCVQEMAIPFDAEYF
jgi:hypothetical protein